MNPERQLEVVNWPGLLRAVTVVTGVGLLLFALGMYYVLPGVMQFWIWPETPALGCVFVAGMLAGGAAPLLWIGLSGSCAAAVHSDPFAIRLPQPRSGPCTARQPAHSHRRCHR